MGTPLNKVIAVDFDGTICDEIYPSCGKKKRNVKRVLRMLKDNLGLTIWIYSCRSHKKIRDISEQQMKDYLIKENIPYDKIITGYQGKPLVDFYIDDRAITFTNKTGWESIYETLEKIYSQESA